MPERLAGLSNADFIKVLINQYRFRVEERGMPFVNQEDSEVTNKIDFLAKWRDAPKYRTGFMLQGCPGNGKTTLLRAVADIYQRYDGNVFFCNAEFFVDQYRAWENDRNSLYEEYKKSRYLFLDDLGTEPIKCNIYGTEHFPIQRLIEYRYSKQLPTFITTNYSDGMLNDRYGNRFFDRLEEMFTILRFSGKSFRHIETE